MTPKPAVSTGASARNARRLTPLQWPLSGLRAKVPAIVIDVGLAATVAGIGLTQSLQRGGPPGAPPRPDDHQAWFVVLAALPLIARSRYPFIPLLAIPIVLVYRLGGGEPSQAFLPAVLLAIYTVVANGPYSRLGKLTWAVCAGLLFLSTHFIDMRELPLSRLALDIGWVATAILLGDNTNSRRALHAVAEQRALEAERTREQEARRRVSEERVAIARELHDVVAHHISIINVQAGVGAHVLDTQPQQSREAFEHIRVASHETLQELRSLLGVLREPLDDGVPLTPTRGLEGLGELLRSVREAGLEVEIETAGDGDVPGHVDRSAYRILQESLTNVLRHAPGARVQVRIEYAPDRLELRVTNSAGMDPSAAGQSAAGSGHGIEGMRERAEAIGGAVVARALPDGGFEVSASLPTTVTQSGDGARA
jgi:signal transduction histidine kinase